MHIGVIAPEYPPELGGMQTYALEFVHALSQHGCTVSVFTRQGDGHTESPAGVKIHRVLEERRRLDRPVLDTPASRLGM